MSAQSFQDRIRRIERNHQSAHGQNDGLRADRSDKDRLQIALSLLERKGIDRGSSFPLLFAWIGRFGLVLRPLHFWPVIPLTALVFTAMSLLFWAVIVICDVAGATAGPILKVIDAGPLVYLSLNFLIAGLYACSVKAQALRLKLPHWREL